MKLPLEGLTVIEMGSALAGPYCGRILGDLGARVIKVEAPRGDPARGWGAKLADGNSAMFHAVNKEKESLVVDFGDPTSVAHLRELIATTADAVVQNLRPGVVEAAPTGPLAVLRRWLGRPHRTLAEPAHSCALCGAAPMHTPHLASCGCAFCYFCLATATMAGGGQTRCRRCGQRCELGPRCDATNAPRFFPSAWR